MLLAEQLLHDFWPESLHAAIRRAIGLPDAVLVPARRKRDPRFREEVLRAYEHRCAVCGYDGRLGVADLGLEAAHVRWHAEGGPDEVDNGLALCAFHHLALDRGALGLTLERQARVSADVRGQTGVEELLYRFVGVGLRAPQPGWPVVADRYVEWHGREVFRGPERGALCAGRR